VSDIDTVAMDGLKALDPKRPIREADIPTPPLMAQAVLKLFGTRQVEARHRFCDLLSIKVCESTFGPPKMLPEASCAT
jgi:hypothetical protein